MDIKRISLKIASDFIHPLDRKAEGWGLLIPEENYHKKVKDALHHIFESVDGVSEKDFRGQDELMNRCDGIVRSPSSDEIIRNFERDGCRPKYCAERIYDQMRRKNME